MFHRKRSSPVWGTRAPLLAKVQNASGNNHQMNTFVDLEARAHSTEVMEEVAAAMPSELEQVIVDDGPVADGDDSDGGCVGNDNPHDVDSRNVETKNDAAGAIQGLVQGGHGNFRTNDYDNVRCLSDCCIVKEAESDDTGRGGANRTHFFLDTGTEGDLPKKA